MSVYSKSCVGCSASTPRPMDRTVFPTPGNNQRIRKYRENIAHAERVPPPRRVSQFLNAGTTQWADMHSHYHPVLSVPVPVRSARVNDDRINSKKSHAVSFSWSSPHQKMLRIKEETRFARNANYQMEMMASKIPPKNIVYHGKRPTPVSSSRKHNMYFNRGSILNTINDVDYHY